MPPFYADDRVTVHHGDCLDVLRALPDCSVDSVVTDPPSGIAFMGKEWDADKGGRDAWVAWLASVLAECRRILKPGGHALVWALPRTSGWTHRAIEDAGLDVRDCITHLFGGGFPKSLDVSKAIDKTNGRRFEDRYALGRHIRERREVVGLTRVEVNAWFGYRDGCEHWERQDPAGARVPTLADWRVLRDRLGLSDEYMPLVERAEAERVVIGRGRATFTPDTAWSRSLASDYDITAPATEDAARWDGWGTALKPSSEMWYLARKPLAGTVAANVVAHGTGALNIAATRVAHDGTGVWGNSQNPDRHGSALGYMGGDVGRVSQRHEGGRWPSNVVLTHSPTDTEDGCEPSCPVAELDTQSGKVGGGLRSGYDYDATNKVYGDLGRSRANPGNTYGDSGGAARFFPVFRYQAKAPTRERPKVDGVAHETVKPLALMIWLAKLVTPPGGTILDPFGGSGTTAEAALAAGFRCITIEREERYLPLILERIRRQQPTAEVTPAAQQMSLLDDPAA